MHKNFSSVVLYRRYMSSTTIYGVDTSKKVTEIQVRDAIIECFSQAHHCVMEEIKNFNDISSDDRITKLKKKTVLKIIKEKFMDVGGDFNHPTKQNLVDVVEKLSEYSSKYRQPNVIDKNVSEIMLLIRLIK
jgi:Zn-dependent oligopeptidase